MQNKLVIALHDDDCLCRKSMSPNFLSRSAKILAKHIPLNLQKKKQQLIAKNLVVVLDAAGPEYYIKQQLGKDVDVRRIGNTYYTKSMAEAVYRKALSCRARMNQIKVKIMGDMRAQGSEVSSLTNVNASFWEQLVEDVMCSPKVKAVLEDQRLECEAHQEFHSLTMDCTYKICAPLMGQAKFRAKREIRESQALPLEEAKIAVCTGRGRTGALLLAQLVGAEGAIDYAGALTKQFTPSQLAQIVHIGVDDPSRRLYIILKEKCPNLESLSLDPIHPVMMFEQAQWGKKTAGSRFLRQIIGKFSNTLSHRDTTRQRYYTGLFTPPLSQEERGILQQVKDGSMALRTATYIKNNLNRATPYESRANYMRGMAALTSLYPDEVRKLCTNGKSVRHNLYCLAMPEKFEWYQNGQKYRQTLPPAWLTLLATGITSNEAFHAEANKWMEG